MNVTVPENAAGGSDALVGFVTILLLVALLIAKETVTAVPDDQGRRFGRILDVALAPLLLAFAILVATKIVP